MAKTCSKRRRISFKTRRSTTASGSSSASRATSTSTAETAEYRYTLLDVFTDQRLAGNGLAVVHDADPLDDLTMLAFARETRLAETTFVQLSSSDQADYRNRIFSMVGEMPFAGHPSLGTAVAVARARGVRDNVSYVQQTGAGLQSIDVELDGDIASAVMLQEPAGFGPELDPAPLLAALGLRDSDACPDLPPQLVSTGISHVMMPLGSEESVGRIFADPMAVDAILDELKAYGIYAAWCEPEHERARTRLFGQSTQIVEDPATGSAAGPLCAYLHRRTGCQRLEIVQGVEIARPSQLSAEVAGERVRVGGQVVAVIDGIVTL